MIPKRVLYCWFGTMRKPPKIEECIRSWKEKLVDWEFIEINENNFDINYNEYTKEAYRLGKYAFVSDVARLVKLYELGGVYLDTDVMLYKPLDKFLKHEVFTGFEQWNYPVTAVMGATKGHWLIKEMLECYDRRKFELKDKWVEYETNTMIMSNVIGKYFNRIDMRYQEWQNIAIYPQEVFCNREGTKYEESYTEHLMTGMW